MNEVTNRAAFSTKIDEKREVIICDQRDAGPEYGFLFVFRKDGEETKISLSAEAIEAAYSLYLHATLKGHPTIINTYVVWSSVDLQANQDASSKQRNSSSAGDKPA